MNSVSSPFFLSSAEDLLRRLEAIATPDGQRLAAEARERILLFRDWPRHRPTDDARIAGIGRLFELNRAAMDWMSKHGHGPPSSGRRPRSTPPSSGSSGSGMDD
jgi:hypothetical protein